MVAGCGSGSEPDDAAPDSTVVVVPTSTTTVAPSTTGSTTSPAESAVPPNSTPFVDGGDPRRAEQWAVEQLDLPAIWPHASGVGVVVAVVDTGVDLDHPDLAGKLVAGIDLVDGDDRPDDSNGHGTHVAGIVAATTGNGVGVSGVAPGAKIMPVRVLGDDGVGDDATIAEGIDWAVANGADVVNLSLGMSGVVARLAKGGPLNPAIRRAEAAGVVVVAAAGNEGQTRRVYRLGVPVLVVNAVGSDGVVAEFSNVGDARAVAAPGVDILSTVPDGYDVLSGTSMAAPIVSGTVALLVGQGRSGPDSVDRLVATATNPSGDPALGAGMVDPKAALDL